MGGTAEYRHCEGMPKAQSAPREGHVNSGWRSRCQTYVLMIFVIGTRQREFGLALRQIQASCFSELALGRAVQRHPSRSGLALENCRTRRLQRSRVARRALPQAL